MSQAAIHEDDYLADPPAVEFTDDDAKALSFDLENIAGGIGSLGTTLAKAVDWLYATGGLEDLAETLDVIRTLRKRLAELESYVEAKCVRLAREQHALHQGTVLPDGRLVEFKGGTDRKDWDVDTVLARVTTAVLNREQMGPGAQAVDPDTGEMKPLRQVVEAVRADLVAVLPNGRNSMRVTRMKQLGIRPDDFCEHTTGRATVHIAPKPDPAIGVAS
jgi:hypothetical protein